MTSFYDGDGSIFVEAYDAFYGPDAAPIVGDVAFYQRLARQLGGPVLELACGTGRVCLELAAAGIDVTGVDLSDAMLAIARRKADAGGSAVRDHLTLARQDMTALDLGGQFGLVFVPFRSFQLLLTIERQRQALAGIRGHLRPGGRLVLHLFDPRLELLIGDGGAGHILSGTHPVTGRRYTGDVLRATIDPVAQLRWDLWRYAEIAADGAVLAEARREMALRWTYRWELHHLLAACGFAVESEYSDFLGSPPEYGREIIVVAA
ncbi:MAG TPA: class I SAM-dependent methyltransferase [Vineibacter sp.]|nr:class I SAM-dependent methyltransferase [Vineibacter sp.]